MCTQKVAAKIRFSLLEWWVLCDGEQQFCCFVLNLKVVTKQKCFLNHNPIVVRHIHTLPARSLLHLLNNHNVVFPKFLL